MQIIQLFAHTDEVNGNGFFAGNGAQHAPFGGAVQFGHNESGEAQGFIESLHLHQGVLTRVAVNDQQDFVRRSSIGFLHHALDFFQLFHQVQLGGQAAGCIDQHHISAAGFARRHGIKTDRSRIATFLADDFNGIALRPHSQLLAGRGPEGVCSG